MLTNDGHSQILLTVVEDDTCFMDGKHSAEDLAELLKAANDSLYVYLIDIRKKRIAVSECHPRIPFRLTIAQVNPYVCVVETKWHGKQRLNL